MLLIGRATAAPLGVQKQHLVAAVCEGVECFRPHCTRPGEQRSQHLRQGGGEVCDQGNRYGAKAVICSRWHFLGAGNAPELLAGAESRAAFAPTDQTRTTPGTWQVPFLAVRSIRSK
jgi:hypothetical protein